MDEEFREEFDGYLDRVRKNDPTLTKLDLFWKKIGPAGAAALADALKVNTTLTSLNLYGNQITDAGVAILAPALGGNTTLTELKLGDNQIGGGGAKALAQALQENRTLTKLDLGDNQIGPAGASALAEVLRGNTTLTELDLTENEIGDVGAASLAKALEGNRTLTELKLWDNQIGDVGATALAETLQINGTLAELSLGSNQIRDAGAKALAEALKVKTTLISLNLEYNEIGDDGVKALAETLQINGTLAELSLGSNQIRDAGAKALAGALEVNRTLTELFLGDNQIGPAGASALAEVLEGNRTLTKLSLRDNQIGNDGVKALAQALKKNETLTGLNLRGNEIKDAGAVAIAEALKVKTTPIYLNLQRNQIGDDGAAAIKHGLQHLQANIEMLESRYQVAPKYHAFNEASARLEKMPEEIWGVVDDFAVAMLVAMGGIEGKRNFIKMRALIKMPDDYVAADVVAKAFEEFTKDEKYIEHFINPYLTYDAEDVNPICISDSVLLERFGQLQDYDKRLRDGIVSFEYNEQGEKVPTAKEFNILAVDIDTLSRMLTKDITKPEDERVYKTIRGQQVEVPGLDFAQIVATRQPILLLNIFTIAKEIPSLMTAFEEKMQANGNELLNVVAEMIEDPKYQNLQSQLSQIVDRVGKITQIDDDEAAIFEGEGAATYGVTDNMTTAPTTAPAFVGTGTPITTDLEYFNPPGFRGSR